MTLQQVSELFQYLISLASTKQRKNREVAEKMDFAKSYDEWLELAKYLDYLKGRDKWREEEKSTLYDSAVLKTRTNDIRRMMKENNVFDLIFRLR
jgi:hypothetical protein